MWERALVTRASWLGLNSFFSASFLGSRYVSGWAKWTSRVGCIGLVWNMAKLKGQHMKHIVWITKIPKKLYESSTKMTSSKIVQELKSFYCIKSFTKIYLYLSERNRKFEFSRKFLNFFWDKIELKSVGFCLIK